MKTYQRKSYTELNKIYFWTATIHKWLPLLESNEKKDLIVTYLKKLSDANLVTVYGFVIMPNHYSCYLEPKQFERKGNPTRELFEIYST